YALDDGLPADEPVLTDLPAGFGPRHIAAWEEVLYVTGELSGEVAALAWDEGTGAGEVVTRAAVSTREGDRYPSHIERLGDWLIIGVRGVNTLSAMAITGNGTGLEALGEVTTVDWPRHLAVAGDYVLVAGEGSDSIGVHPSNPPESDKWPSRSPFPPPCASCRCEFRRNRCEQAPPALNAARGPERGSPALNNAPAK